MMCSKEYIEQTEQSVLHTYNRFPLVLERGKEPIYMMWRERNIWISEPVLLCSL